MAIPILNTWKNYFSDPHEGLGSSYERIVLNNLLLFLKATYQAKTILEVPIFGFTGLTGLNSIALAKKGCEVTLGETDNERAMLVSELLKDITPLAHVRLLDAYHPLPFENKSFDLSWNFSALWFVADLHEFVSELIRVTKKVILLCVPNQYGLGYKWQKAHADIPEGIGFNEDNINPQVIRFMMRSLGWNLIEEAYIDCPLWPDIGMNKESFFGKYLTKTGIKKTEPKPRKCISILDYYKDNDPGFAERMKHYAALENYAPQAFKKMWSHHRWMLFTSPDLK